MIDYSRIASTIDVAGVMRPATVVQVGCGGGRHQVELLAHTGLGRVVVIDPDRVEARNPATQGHRLADCGALKVEATAASIAAINPDTEVVALPVVWDEAIRGDAAAVIAGADLIALATDDYRANRAVMRWAMARGIDVVEAMIYPEGACVEHVVTWGSVLATGGGCGTCHTKGRFDAFAAGYRPPADLPTQILAAELSCVHGALLIVSRLHQRAGSHLPIAGIARAFERHPFHLTRLLPSFWAAPGEPFADAPPDTAFLARGYALDTPPGWTCPDCGTRRADPSADRPDPNARPGT